MNVLAHVARIHFRWKGVLKWRPTVTNDNYNNILFILYINIIMLLIIIVMHDISLHHNITPINNNDNRTCLIL